MTQTASREACPISNLCRESEPWAPECGAAPEHRDPAATVESMCVYALYGQLRRADAGVLDIRSGYGGVRELQAGSALIELSLSPAIGQVDAEEYRDEAETRLSAAVSRGGLRMPDLVQASLLHANLPAFAARRRREPVGADDQAAIGQAIADAYGTVMAAPVHFGQHDAHRLETDHTPCLGLEKERIQLAGNIGTMLLARRTGLTVLPATYRQRYAGDVAGRPAVRDMSIMAGDVSLPVRCKQKEQGGNADPTVLTVAFGSLAVTAAAELGDTGEGRKKSVLAAEAAAALADEASGTVLEPAVAERLDAMGRALSGHITAYIDRLAGAVLPPAEA